MRDCIGLPMSFSAKDVKRIGRVSARNIFVNGYTKLYLMAYMVAALREVTPNLL